MDKKNLSVLSYHLPLLVLCVVVGGCDLRLTWAAGPASSAAAAKHLDLFFCLSLTDTHTHVVVKWRGGRKRRNFFLSPSSLSGLLTIPVPTFSFFPPPFFSSLLFPIQIACSFPDNSKTDFLGVASLHANIVAAAAAAAAVVVVTGNVRN